uniref:interleukin-1 beta n=1 Tax=Semicossyphus pulcher TaxID=241346 RepID=UPI0037E8EA6D
MSDFDLFDALPDSVDCDKEEYKTSCCNKMDDQTKTSPLDEGLDLEVSHNPKSFQCAVTLMLAGSRFKRLLNCSGRELCSAIMECFMEETIVERTAGLCKSGKIFTRANSEHQCTLSDKSKKSIVLAAEALKLQAYQLRAGYENSKVLLKMSRYSCSSINGQTVLLSINQSYKLVCRQKGDEVELGLEKCSLELQDISEDKTHYLFYKKASDVTFFTFESVRFPGWFISTDNESEGLSVDMCRQEAVRLTQFQKD